MRRVQGGALSADEDELRRALMDIEAKIAGNNACEIWNADEFGLFYRHKSGWKLSKEPPSGH